jgi:LAGLIDADG endonuclease
MKTGKRIELIFGIGLHKKYLNLLEKIRLFFNVGNIISYGEDVIQFKVRSIKDLKIIIDHFEKYPLLTQKHANYLLFKMAFDIISSGEHLTEAGIKKL